MNATPAMNTKRRNQFWTSEKEARLISLYKMHRLLWDSRHPDYYKRDRRGYAMRAIAGGMDNEFDVVNVKDKIKTLRDYFVKEMKKEESSRTSSSPGYVSRWEHFSSWEFLRSVICSNPALQRTINVPYVEVKREQQDVVPVFPVVESPDPMILPSTPCSSSDGEDPSSSRNTSPPPHMPSSGALPLHKLFLLKSLPGPAQGLVPSVAAGSNETSPHPPVPKRHRRSTSQDRTPAAQSNHQVVPPANCGQASNVSCRPIVMSVANSNGACTSAEALSHRGSMSGDSPGELNSCDDDEVLFNRHLIFELREMTKYQRDLAKLRIQQTLFEVKYMSQAYGMPTQTPQMPEPDSAGARDS